VSRRAPRRAVRPGSGQGLVAVLQLCDSAFPAGLFTQSAGLETAFAEERLRDAGDLRDWVADALAWSAAPLDAAATADCWRAAGRGDLAGVCTHDARLEAMRTAREPREASARSGRRVLALAAALEGEVAGRREAGARAVLAAFAEAARQNRTPGHYAAALGVVGRAWGAPLLPLLGGALFAAAAGMVAAAVRLGACDHVAAQRILAGLRPEMGALARSAAAAGRDAGAAGLGAGGWSAFAPAAEIAAMRHETGRMRMFAT